VLTSQVRKFLGQIDRGPRCSESVEYARSLRPTGGAFRLAVALSVVVSAGCAGRTPALPETAEATPRSTGFVERPDSTRIYYETAGSGPAVVLIHGLGGNHAVWYRQVPRLARRYTVVTVSQRGFAPSTGDRHDLDVARTVDDLMAVLDELAIDSAVVVGQSMGGWTALAATLAHPDRIRAAVLADTTAGIFDETIATHYRAVTERARALADRPPPLGRHPALDADFSRSHPEEAYLYQLLSTFGAPAPGYVASALGLHRQDPAALAANRRPVLFIVGERDRIFPPDIVRRAASLLAGSQVRVIADSGHSPYFEKPRRWSEIVEVFLDDIR